MKEAGNKLPGAAQVVRSWLFSAGTWIYSHTSRLQRWHPVVFCSFQENFATFPLEPCVCVEALPQLSRIYNKGWRRWKGYAPAHVAAARREGVRLLHAHFGPTGFSTLPLRRRLELPLVTSFYGFDLSLLPRRTPVWRDHYRALFDSGSLFLVEGPHMASQLEALGCPRKKITVHRLGVELSRLPYVDRSGRASSEVRVLAAATFTEKKGLRDAVEAFGLAASKVSEVSLTVVGDARDRPEELAIKAELEALVDRYNLRSKVRFLGYQSHDRLIEEYLSHDLFISPSVQAADGDNEGGSPVTITEAAATGLPVISTTHCDIPEVVVHGETGFLAPERDPACLAEHLSHVAADEGLRSRLGKAARAHVEDRFDLRKTVAFLERTYDEVAGVER